MCRWAKEEIKGEGRRWEREWRWRVRRWGKREEVRGGESGGERGKGLGRNRVERKGRGRVCRWRKEGRGECTGVCGQRLGFYSDYSH